MPTKSLCNFEDILVDSIASCDENNRSRWASILTIQLDIVNNMCDESTVRTIWAIASDTNLESRLSPLSFQC